MRVAVYGLWHLGCVTASCLAAGQHDVVGFDPDLGVVEDLRLGRPPLREPGLDDLIAAGLQSGKLRFTSRVAEALRGAEVLWVTFDTPVDDHDEADVAVVRRHLDAVADDLRPGTVVLVSSQVPVGFMRELQTRWHGRGLRFAYSPENLRLGKALDSFCHPDRVIVGIDTVAVRETIVALFAPYCRQIEWMTIASAEMTKHAINAFLATSVTFINELARLCEATGADAREVERGLRSEGRIGARAYLTPGAAFAGGTLARDLRFLVDLGRTHLLDTPLFDGVCASNTLHQGWLREQVSQLLADATQPVVAVLGLTYKPGTSTLRRSAALELCQWLLGQGVHVQAHDPLVAELPGELGAKLELRPGPREALTGAEVAVIATACPEFRCLSAGDFLAAMRRPRVVDANWFLAGALAEDERIVYRATGRPGQRPAA